MSPNIWATFVRKLAQELSKTPNLVTLVVGKGNFILPLLNDMFALPKIPLEKKDNCMLFKTKRVSLV